MSQVHDLLRTSYDIQFGTNVLAHFHFTTLLLPALLAAESPRVINVSSSAHRFTPAGGIDFDRLKGAKQGSCIPVRSLLERYQWYGQSKLGNVLFTKELVRRYGDKGLISLTLHPGYISTNLNRYHSWPLQTLNVRVLDPDRDAVS